jgi:hypothetical protein
MCRSSASTWLAAHTVASSRLAPATSCALSRNTSGTIPSVGMTPPQSTPRVELTDDDQQKQVIELPNRIGERGGGRQAGSQSRRSASTHALRARTRSAAGLSALDRAIGIGRLYLPYPVHLHLHPYCARHQAARTYALQSCNAPLFAQSHTCSATGRHRSCCPRQGGFDAGHQVELARTQTIEDTCRSARRGRSKFSTRRKRFDATQQRSTCKR